MTGREQARLQKAQHYGYLDACCKDNQALVYAFGLWCWRLKIPIVWLERRSPYSRFGRVQLEMFTSSNRLTAGGQAVMKDVCAPGNAARWTQVSAHDARWDHVAMPNARDLAHAVFRAAIRPENYERNQIRVEDRKAGKVLQMALA